MAKKTRPPRRLVEHPVEVGGHRGYYTLDRGQITVYLIGGGSKAADWSASGKHDTLARILLLELVTQR